MKKPLATLIALAVSTSALANDGPYEWLSLSGFGSLGTTRTDDADIAFRLPSQKNYKANAWSTEVDSRVAAQFDINQRGKISGVLQLMGIQRNQGDFRVDVEWANVAWQVNEQWRLRAGRMVTPVFLQSDHQYVGYSLIPARYALEIANNYPLARHDGAELLYNTELGGGQIMAQAYAGTTDYKSPTLDFDADLVMGLALTYSNGPYTLRGSVSRADLKVAGSSASAFGALANLGNPAFAPICPNCAAEAAKISEFITGAQGSFFGLGAVYDNGPMYAQIEYGVRRANATIPDTSGLMLLGAYRLSSVTPYLGYSFYQTHSNTSAAIAIPNGAPASFAALARAYNGVLESSATDRQIFTLGTRWDFYRNVALKVQAEFVKHDHPERAMSTTWTRTASSYDGKTNLYTATLDFVF